MANVVVTGTVKKVMLDDRDSNRGMYKSEIEIKRVLKGENVVNQLANFIDPVRQHKMVMVDGFGDPHICENEVHVADTKIFLLNKGYNGELRLNSSILPITVVNLNYAEAVVKGRCFRGDHPHKMTVVTFVCVYNIALLLYSLYCMSLSLSNTI